LPNCEALIPSISPPIFCCSRYSRALVGNERRRVGRFPQEPVSPDIPESDKQQAAGEAGEIFHLHTNILGKNT